MNADEARAVTEQGRIAAQVEKNLRVHTEQQRINAIIKEVEEIVPEKLAAVYEIIKHAASTGQSYTYFTLWTWVTKYRESERDEILGNLLSDKLRESGYKAEVKIDRESDGDTGPSTSGHIEISW